MNKQFFAVKIIPSRADFAQTMTDDEKNIMGQHAMYWKDRMEKGMVYAFGPVFDPKGAYGFGIITAETTEQVEDFVKNDPATQIHAFEYYPMMAIVKGE